MREGTAGSKKPVPIITAGAPFHRGESFWLRLQFSPDAPPDGYFITLGMWAEAYIKQSAMLGSYLSKLAEYNMQRDQWERRIGQYLMFVMNMQATKAQKGVTLRTILTNSHVEWEKMAKTNPGKVIEQFVSAVHRFKEDGIFADVACTSGSWDGSDVPVRGRLGVMLNRVYIATPGNLNRKHIAAKTVAKKKQTKPKRPV